MNAYALPAHAIEAEGLVKVFPAYKGAPAKRALNGVDLKIPRGSIFGLLGPNGAGKSTFINILAGLTLKTEGRVAIWDRDIDVDPRASRAAIGVVPQELAVDVFFTPREALEVQAGLYGVPKKERRTAALLGALGLTDKADAYVRQLWNYVVELNNQGVTIVLTTHYLEEAEELCDTIAILNRGEVVACEPTPKLLRRLDTRTVVVTPEDPLDAAPKLGAFETRLRTDGSLAVAFHATQTPVEDVLSAIRAGGIRIKDLATENPDLEDVFLSLTYDAPGAADPTRD